MAAEKRKYPRVKNFRLFVETKGKDENNFYTVEIVNLAAGGLCFLRKFVVNMNDLLTFRFSFKSGPIALNGSVMRIYGREVGVKFLDDENELKSFVDNYNTEVAGLMIDHPHDTTKLVIPGYTYDPKKEDDLSSMLEIE